MASIARPTLLRSTLNATPAKRISGQVTPLAFRTASSSAWCQQSLKSSFVRNALPRATRVAAFHATTRRAILPPLPQTVKGTVNDPAPVPETSYLHGSYHWTFERAISAGLIPLTIAPFAAGSLNPVTDAVFCALILLHSHIGFQAAITDYFPKSRVPKTKKFFDWLLNVCTVAVGIALYEFETNDVGVTEAIKRVWHA